MVLTTTFRTVIRLTAAVALAIGLVACGTDAEPAESTTSVPVETTAPDTTAPDTVPPTTAPAPETTTTTTTVPPTTSTTVPATTTPTTVPGEAIDFGPADGDVLGVVGVRHDDVLNVRSGPGTEFGVIAELDPTADDVVALGNTWSRPGSLWIEVDADGEEGWVNLRYVAYLGDTRDATSELIPDMSETRAETMLDLGSLVAEAVAGDSDAVSVMSVAPSVGDLGEVTYDVIGFEDDSVRGVRIHVFGTPDAGGEGFALKSVELTVLCSRGVSDGLCV
jgi:hypothetical protein